MTLDNNNDVLVHFKPFFSLYTLPHTSVGLTGSISIFFSFEYFDSFDKSSLLCLFTQVSAVNLKENAVAVNLHCSSYKRCSRPPIALL